MFCRRRTRAHRLSHRLLTNASMACGGAPLRCCPPCSTAGHREGSLMFANHCPSLPSESTVSCCCADIRLLVLLGTMVLSLSILIGTVDKFSDCARRIDEGNECALDDGGPVGDPVGAGYCFNMSALRNRNLSR